MRSRAKGIMDFVAEDKSLSELVGEEGMQAPNMEESGDEWYAYLAYRRQMDEIERMGHDYVLERLYGKK